MATWQAEVQKNTFTIFHVLNNFFVFVNKKKLLQLLWLEEKKKKITFFCHFARFIHQFHVFNGIL